MRLRRVRIGSHQGAAKADLGGDCPRRQLRRLGRRRAPDPPHPSSVHGVAFGDHRLDVVGLPVQHHLRDAQGDIGRAGGQGGVRDTQCHLRMRGVGLLLENTTAGEGSRRHGEGKRLNDPASSEATPDSR